MKLTKTQTAILKTISYADVFSFPLRVGEIHQYLIHNHPISLPIVRSNLAILESRKLIFSKHGIGESLKFYFLQGRSLLANLRPKRQLITEQKAKIGEMVGKWLFKLPYVQAVYITGATAVGNATQNDDIDLMIITKNQSLWTTRLIINASLDLFQIRRKPGKHQTKAEVKDKICTNLFLDTTRLKVPSSKHNLYTAHEVVQALPLYSQNSTHQHFLWENRWVKQFLPNTHIPQKPTDKKLTGQPSINHFFFSLQHFYMKPKITTELVTPNSAYFHPRDTSNLVLSKYHQRLKKLGIDHA